EKGAPEAPQAQGIVELLNQAIQEAYNLAKGLHPVKLEADGLLCALDELAAKTQARFGTICALHFRDHAPIPENQAAIHLYRVAQEAIFNAIKHAHATRLDISLIGFGSRRL